MSRAAARSQGQGASRSAGCRGSEGRREAFPVDRRATTPAAGWQRCAHRAATVAPSSIPPPTARSPGPFTSSLELLPLSPVRSPAACRPPRPPPSDHGIPSIPQGVLRRPALSGGGPRSTPVSRPRVTTTLVRWALGRRVWGASSCSRCGRCGRAGGIAQMGSPGGGDGVLNLIGRCDNCGSPPFLTSQQREVQPEGHSHFAEAACRVDWVLDRDLAFGV